MNKKCLLLILVTMFSCIFMGGIINPTEVMAKDQILGSSTITDAPEIELDKLYHLAKRGGTGAEKADILVGLASMGSKDRYEFLCFEIEKKTTIKLYLKDTAGKNTHVELYGNSPYRYLGSVRAGKAQNSKESEVKFTLEKGFYYLKIKTDATADLKISSGKEIVLLENEFKMKVGDKATIDAVMTKNDKVVKNAKFTYKSSNNSIAKVSSKGKIVAKAPGVCKISVKSNGITEDVKVIVLPEKVKGLKQLEKRSNSIKLSWKEQSNVSGYEIWMYDEDLESYEKVKTVSSDFSVAIIKKLEKGKTYKIRIRAFVKDGSKKYYGAYSKVYKMKTK